MNLTPTYYRARYLSCLLLILLTSTFALAEPAKYSLTDAVFLNAVEPKVKEKGSAAGDIADLQLTNTTDSPIVVDVPLGTMLVPEKGLQTRMVSQPQTFELAPGETASRPLKGVCVEYQAPVPKTGTQNRYAFFHPSHPQDAPDGRFPAESLRDFAGVIPILDTVDRLEKQGKLNNNLGPRHATTVAQLTTWSYLQRNSENPHNKEKLFADIDLTVKQSGVDATPEQVEALSENIWADINLVAKESDTPIQNTTMNVSNETGLTSSQRGNIGRAADLIERMGDEFLARRIRRYLRNGWIHVGSIDGNAETDAYNEITIDRSGLPTMRLDPDTASGFESIVILARTLTHEFHHVDQNRLYRATSNGRHTVTGLPHHSENDAWVTAVEANRIWLQRYLSYLQRGHREFNFRGEQITRQDMLRRARSVARQLSNYIDDFENQEFGDFDELEVTDQDTGETMSLDEIQEWADQIASNLQDQIVE